MTPEGFQATVSSITATIAGKPLDAALERELNARYPAGGEIFQRISEACVAAAAAGWMCNRGEGNRKFGRVIEPSAATHGFSVDVVELTDVVGPHHTHPTGEIDLIMPQDAMAKFDGRGAGWLVYGAGSAHRPTVTGGRAFVLYLLPNGEIKFT